MSRKRKQRRKQPVEYHPPAQAPAKRTIPKWLLPFSIGVALTAVVAMAAYEPSTATPRRTVAAQQSSLPTLGELALMPADELAEQDLALMNLRCADGLPGSEDLDVRQCLATLDKWAAWTKRETDRHFYKFRRNPADYENSEGYFRMLMLITVLQQDFKVHYNPERIRDVDFTKSKDLFIHGMIDCDNGGTCVSMPVLYTAVARRLGYPVYLVTAKAHVFCRWDAKGDRFNIEATNQGMNCFDDDYYMKWPKPIAAAEVKAGHYLKSLDASESLAMFLAARGHCLEDNRFGAKARVAYAMAAEKKPQDPIYFGYLAQTLRPPTRLAGNYTRRRPSEPPMVYQQHNPWPEPQQHNVFKPTVPGTVDPFSPQQQSGIPNPVGFGFQP